MTMGEVVTFPDLGARRRPLARRGPPPLPTRHLPELVPPPLPQFANLSLIEPAPSDWQGAPVVIEQSLWWGRVCGFDPTTGKLVVVHQLSRDVLLRSYDAGELRHSLRMPHNGRDLVMAPRQLGENPRSGIARRTDQRNAHLLLPPVNEAGPCDVVCCGAWRLHAKARDPFDGFASSHSLVSTQCIKCQL